MTIALRTLLFASAAALLAACTVQTVAAPAPQEPAAPQALAAPARPAPTTTFHAPATPMPSTTPPAAAPTPVAPAAPTYDPKSLDACCAALDAVKRSGRGVEAKRKSAQADQICPGISKLVRDGKTTRDAGLAQIRSALTGVDVPPECQ